MPLTDIQKVQRDTLALFPRGQSAEVPGISCPEAAGKLGINPGAVRQRLIRYEREGWLERAPLADGQGFAYRITERGTARLDWLRTQEPSGKSSSVVPWLIGGALVGVAAILLKRLKTLPSPPPDKDQGGNHV